MIGKVAIGKTFRGCVNYVMGKKGAEVLDQYGVRSQSALTATQDFDAIRKQNQEIGNAVWHTSISFALTDKVDNDLMMKVAHDYLKKMNLKEHQFLIVRHHDTRHQHVHIISNRVGFDGSVASDQWCKNRTAHTCDSLEEKYKLTVARDQSKKKDEERSKIPAVKEAKERIKLSVEKAVAKGAGSYPELRAALKKEGIDLQLQEQSTGRINGVTFKSEDIILKGSAIDPSMSYKRLGKQLDKNKGNDRGIRL